MEAATLKSDIRIVGSGHCIGSEIVSNTEVALALGLEATWFEDRTGIVERRVCGPGENVVTLAEQAISNACADAGLDLSRLGHETVLIHIQNGFTSLAPPPGILICDNLGMHHVRTFGIDGVCSEPINALELAGLMLDKGLCEHVIISAAVDFVVMVDPNDPNTIGLFGAGAGAIVVARTPDGENSKLLALSWETQSKYSKLGVIPILGGRRHEKGIELTLGYYEMKGTELAKVGFKSVPRVVLQVLQQAPWELQDIHQVISHQPNAKLIDILMRQLSMDSSLVFKPVSHLGNMGPASLLVSLSLAKEQGKIKRGDNVLLVSFGLGFSCGAAAIVF